MHDWREGRWSSDKYLPVSLLPELSTWRCVRRGRVTTGMPMSMSPFIGLGVRMRRNRRFVHSPSIDMYFRFWSGGRGEVGWGGRRGDDARSPPGRESQTGPPSRAGWAQPSTQTGGRASFKHFYSSPTEPMFFSRNAGRSNMCDEAARWRVSRDKDIIIYSRLSSP